MSKPVYCINDKVDNCKSCSLSNYMRDCKNNLICTEDDEENDEENQEKGEKPCFHV
jgi:hypothetical protein